MDSETNKTLPVSVSLKSEGKEKNGPAMTKQGAYAAISYMASAGQVHSSFLLNCISFIFFCGFVLTYSLVDDKMWAKKRIWEENLVSVFDGEEEEGGVVGYCSIGQEKVS